MGRFAVALFVGSASLVAGAGACSTGSDSLPSPALSDVVFQGAATPEALTALLAAKVETDPMLAANFSWQSAGDELPLDPIPIFCWHIGSSSASAVPTPMKSLDDSSTRTALAAPWELRPKSTASRIDRAANELVRGLLSGVPEAHAAGAKTNGLGFFLVFSTSKDPKLIRVFTTGTEYTPNQAAWDKITHAGDLVTVRLTNANFNNDQITSGGGPFQGVDISFTFPVM